jgi:hypothetical protein
MCAEGFEKAGAAPSAIRGNQQGILLPETSAAMSRISQRDVRQMGIAREKTPEDELKRKRASAANVT